MMGGFVMNLVSKYISSIDVHMKEVLSKASSALLIRVLGTVLGFVVSVIIARLLGAEGSGVYFLAFSMAMIISTIGRLGFDNTVVRFVASSASIGNWKDVEFVHDYAIRVAFIGTSLLAVTLFFGAEWLAITVFNKPLMAFPLMLVAVAVLPLSIAMIQAESLRGLKCIPASQWIKMVFVSLVTLILLYPFIQVWGVNGAVASFAVAAAASAFIAHLLWKSVCKRKFITNDSEKRTLTSSNLFQSSWPLFIVALTGLVILQSGTILLGAFGSAEDVGIFNIANRVASLLLFPLMAMISILAPKFSEMHQNGDGEGLRKLAQKSSGILMLFAGSVALLVGANAEWILSFFGENFKEGAFILQVLLIGVVVNASAGAVTELLMMTGNEALVRRNMLFSAGAQLLLCIILIPRYGMSGAAYAAVIGGVLWNVWMVWTVKKALGYWPVGRGE